MKPIITAERVRELFDYEEDTGYLLWKIRTARCRRISDLAGHEALNGYRHVPINGKMYLAHRLIWLHKTGEWPKNNVDHIDGDPRNNRWNNLRDVSQSQNCHNVKPSSGVSYNKRSSLYHARIRINYRTYSLGYFKTKEEAEAAYLEKKLSLTLRANIEE